MRADLDDGRAIVIKAGVARDQLDIEGRSVETLGRVGGLPVPHVFLSEPDLLVMSCLPNDGRLTASAQIDAAQYVSGLHAVPQEGYGFGEDTRIGPLRQKNPTSKEWVPFFREHRLLAMGRVALDRGRMTAGGFSQLETLAARLDGLIDEPAHPSLLHGDMWTGNVLAANGQITGFIDPAVYHGDSEMDLAFSTLFGTFGDDFFDAYREARPFDYAGFLEARRDLYNLYPLLVHTALFGGSYADAVACITRRFVG